MLGRNWRSGGGGLENFRHELDIVREELENVGE